MLPAGIVFAGVSVCVCLSVRLSAQNLKNYWSETDITWYECPIENAKSDWKLVTFHFDLDLELFSYFLFRLYLSNGFS